MNDPEDPPRLVDPNGPGPSRLRELVEASRRDVGSESELAALGAALAPHFGATAAAAKGAALGGKVTTGMLVKGGLVAVALGASAVFVTTRSGAPEAPAGPVATQAPSPAVRVPDVPPPSDPVAPSAALAPPSVADAPAAESHSPPAARPAARPSASAASPTSEADLLGRAQAALAGNPALALALADAHRQQFPHAVLGQEREVIAIEALSRLGRRSEAAARAKRFLDAHPTSAHRSKLESIVEHP